MTYRGLKVAFKAQLDSVCHMRRYEFAPVMPVELFLEVTNFCNLKCSICPHHRGLDRPKGYMSLELFEHVLGQIEGKIPKVNLFLAGEPLLHKHIFEMIHMAAGRGFYTRIHTNGQLLDEARARALLASGLDEISFSFDGSSRNKYLRIRGQDALERLVANIRTFLRLKQGCEAKRPYTLIQEILMPGEDAEAVRRSLKTTFAGLPYDELKLIASHSWAGSISGTLRGQPRSKRDYFPCALVWNRISVTWDGKVVGCCNDLLGRHILGDVREETIEAIWNGRRHVELRRALIEGRFTDIPICSGCDSLWEGRPRARLHHHFLGLLLDWYTRTQKASASGTT